MADEARGGHLVDLTASLHDLHVRYARTREPAIREYLLARHARLAQHLATRFGARGLQTREDVIQVAYLGLIKALEGFDPTRGCAFSTYATQTILGELKRNLRDHGWALRPGRGVHDRYLEVESCVDELTQLLGRVPTIPEVAQRVRLSVEEVLEAREAASRRNLDSIDGDRRGAHGSAQSIGAEDDGFENVERRLTFEQLLGALDCGERRLLRMRFVEGRSQAQIARELETSQMQVSRRLRRLYDRLRPALEGGRVQRRQAERR